MIARLTLIALLIGCGDDDDTPLPCDVDTVIEDNCRLCHNSDLDFGAPMALESWEDTQDLAPTDDSIRVWELMQVRVHSPGSPMPPAGVGELTAADLATLDAWFDASAPAGDTDCN